MKKCIVAGILVIGLAPAALATEKFFVTVDTVGNCSVVQGGLSAGKTAIGNASGYDSMEAAKKALDEIRKNDPSKCKGVVVG